MKVALLLGLAAVAGAVWAIPGVRRATARFLRLSAERSPAVLTQFERSRWRLLSIVLWFAAFTSLADIAYLTYSKEISGYKIISFDFMWQVPAGYALIFAPIALLVMRPSRRSLSAVVFLSSLVCTLALLPIASRSLYYWAAIVLAVGAARQMTRGWCAHTWIAAKVVRSGVPLTAIVLVLAGVFFVRPIADERRSLAELPAAPVGPNIVLIVLDTVRAKSLGLYGYERPTSPALDQFASRGLVFDRAYATAPWTLPSHASMFTGRLAHEQSGSFARPLDATHPTVAELLGKRGYLTAGFVANTWYGDSAFGLARGLQRYEDTEMSAFTMFHATMFGHDFVRRSRLRERVSTHDNLDRKSAEEINRAFFDWLARADASRPFFAFLNYCDAHSPYLPPEPFATKFTSKRPFGHVSAKQLDEWGPDDMRAFNDAYDEAITYLDSQLDVLFRTIDSTPRLGNTIVIVTSDHGDQFGEHGLMEHVNSLYLPLLHVPLVIVGPGFSAGQRSGNPVSLRDIAATILQAAGVQGADVPGQSLVSRAATEDSGAAAVLLSEVDRAMPGTYPEWYPARKGHMKTLITRDWQYIRNFGDGKEELFDLRADPTGLTDLASREPARLNEFRLRLDAIVKAPAPRR